MRDAPGGSALVAAKTGGKMEIDLGTPRASLRLAGNAGSPKLMATKSGADHTDTAPARRGQSNSKVIEGDLERARASEHAFAITGERDLLAALPQELQGCQVQGIKRANGR